MIMRAKQDGNVIVFELEGHLDFETTQQFEETCASFIRNSSNESQTPRVIFNMEKLKFVGSSGINQFIKVLKDFNALDQKPRLCRLSSEFQKIFRAYETSRNPFEIFDDETQAVVSFDLAPAPKRTRKPKK